MNNKLKKKNGFTLIELMIVICIISILAAIMIPQFAKYKEETQDKTHTRIEISIEPEPGPGPTDKYGNGEVDY